MAKLIGLAFAATVLLSSANPVGDKFAKYKAIEAYEIRPGILMMPKYSADGQVCEIGLEKLHYSPEIIRLDSSLSSEEIDPVLEELAPADERGSRSTNLGALVTQWGRGMTTTTEYQNVSIQIYSDSSQKSVHSAIIENDLVATIKWKNRKC